MTRTVSTSALSVAIVGCGVIGLNHARAIGRHPELVLAALVDAAPATARALADHVESELGVARPGEFGSLDEAMRRVTIDLVVVCTPSGLHTVVAEEALAAGRHALIEKPLDATMARARRMVDLAADARARGLTVSVISQHRFDPASIVVAEAAREGTLGRLTSGVASVAWWRSQGYYDSGQWRGTWELDGGGAAMNQGVHTVDLLLWFLGRPVEVFAQTALLAHERVDIEDVAVATVRFESGALGVIHATTAAYPGLAVRIQVHGDRGSAIIHNDRLEYFFAADPDTMEAGGSGAVNRAPALMTRGAERGDHQVPDPFVLGHLRQYDDVVAAIRQGRPPGVGVDDAFLALATVRAIYLSATLGRAVGLDEVLSGGLDDVVVSTGVLA